MSGNKQAASSSNSTDDDNDADNDGGDNDHNQGEFERLSLIGRLVNKVRKPWPICPGVGFRGVSLSTCSG